MKTIDGYVYVLDSALRGCRASAGVLWGDGPVYSQRTLPATVRRPQGEYMFTLPVLAAFRPADKNRVTYNP